MTIQIFAYLVMPAMAIGVGFLGYWIIVWTDPARQNAEVSSDLFDKKHA